VKLLHELLETLAVLRPASEGTLAELLDAIPSPTLRDAQLVVISTRPLNLGEEAERSKRLSGTSARNLLGRAAVLNAAQGELTDLFQYGGGTARTMLEHRLSSAEQDRLSSQEDRRRSVTSGEGVADPAAGSHSDDGRTPL
jgi:hypothetical protein